TAKDTNEECYLYTKLMRSLGITYLDHCARLCHSSSVPALAESFGRGAMTQHFIDVKNADVIMIIGSNAAECHPMLCKWIAEARNPNNPITQGKTKLISVDARFTRTSSKADIYAKMRSGTDIAFIGGMIKYAIDNHLYNEKYLKECTNALFKVRTDFKTCAENNGVFSGLTGGTWDSIVQATLDATYNKTTHDYQKTGSGPYIPELATTLDDPDCVFQKLRYQFCGVPPGSPPDPTKGYSIERVCAITGTDPDVYEQICQTFCSTYPDDKSATICYAMGTTQHTVGVQNIRAYAILQLLLGNVGVAGGGINAMRGQDNVQGSTDQALLFHILPGYLRCPDINDTDLTTWLNNFHTASKKVEPTHNYTCRGVTNVNPVSAYWWQNADKYIVSLIKAWWPTENFNVAFNYLPKKQAGKDQSILSIFDAMYNGELKGFICDGENPAVSDADSRHVRHALRELDWMVCIDPFETETAAFWKVDLDGNPLTPEQMASIGTTVYLLPCAVSIEKYGSRSNSGRWIQWHFKGGNPPGEAKPDIEIITLLGQALQSLYSSSSNPKDDPIKKLKWPCLNYSTSDDLTSNAFAEKVAKEMNGYNMSDGKLVNGFANLKADGTTACGNWLHCGSFIETANLDSFENANQSMFASTVGNRMSRQYPADVPNGGPSADPLYKNIGLHSYWSFSWPVNRRIIYNRASTYISDGGSSGAGLAGDPLAPQKYVLRWVETNPVTKEGKWVGDVPDHGAPATHTSGATPADPVYPFIMLSDGHGHLFGGWGIKDGPFPWHYEPLESPIPYPSWLGDGTYRVNPIVHNFRPRGAIYAAHNGGNDPNYPIFATSYRLTEHWHTGSMSRNLPRLNELMPEPFVEMSEELADELGIANGELVNIYSARNPKGIAPPVQMKACVTERFKPYKLGEKTVHHVGFVWHWGYMTINPGVSANILTVFVGDANTYIPETKCFRVKIEKIS
ncbi:MAG: molybdopterin-dependent oxidoreductase, partial [Candidatus Aenigmatarchaeota archaeon]